MIDLDVVVIVPRLSGAVPNLDEPDAPLHEATGHQAFAPEILGPLLVHAVLEASNAVILHFTRPGLQAAEAVEDEALIAATREMLKYNPRLVRSCVAFQDDSPIMQGLDL